MTVEIIAIFLPQTQWMLERPSILIRVYSLTDITFFHVCVPVVVKNLTTYDLLGLKYEDGIESIIIWHNEREIGVYFLPEIRNSCRHVCLSIFQYLSAVRWNWNVIVQGGTIYIDYGFLMAWIQPTTMNKEKYSGASFERSHFIAVCGFLNYLDQLQATL